MKLLQIKVFVAYRDALLFFLSILLFFHKKDPPKFRGIFFYDSDYFLLNHYSAHGEPVSISVNNFHPVESFSISTHINIHSVVRSSHTIVLREYPVSFSIVNNDTSWKVSVVCNTIVPDLESSTAGIWIDEAFAACRIFNQGTVGCIGTSVNISNP